MEEKKEKKISTDLTKGVVAAKVLIEPWITEASTVLGELNKYVFKVFNETSKKQIKEAVEKIYKVKVLSVNVISIPRKMRTQGRKSGWKAGFKKAIVTLKEGDNIDLFGNK
jgi:large subunit ribosomal protein L23